MSESTHVLDDVDLATVLAALRFWQRVGLSSRHKNAEEFDIATTEDREPLNFDEIDELCERLNFAEDAPAAPAKVWVLSTCIPGERRPCFPGVFTSEAAAEAAFDEAMRNEWQQNTPHDPETGDPLPYPDDAREAVRLISADVTDGSWGEWELTVHTLPVTVEPEPGDEFDNRQADSEGWSIFDRDGSNNGPWQLQRCDDSDAFKDDDGAWKFVWEKAKAGSAYHIAAIDYIKSHNPLEYAFMARVFAPEGSKLQTWGKNVFERAMTQRPNSPDTAACLAFVGDIPPEAAEVDYALGTYEDPRLVSAGYIVCGSGADTQWHWCARGGQWHDGYRSEHAAVNAALRDLRKRTAT